MGGTLISRFADLGVSELLRAYPGLSIKPASNGTLIVQGDFRFSAVEGDEKIEDIYQLEIRVPGEFPGRPLQVTETNGRIPSSYHSNPDGTLCLGSPMRIQLALAKYPTLPSFIKECLIPYLFGFSHYEKTGNMRFPDLQHGHEGLFDEYMSILGVHSKPACLEMLRLLGLKKRHANKQLCPCNSGHVVGKCHSRTLNQLRKSLSRTFWREQYVSLARFASGTTQHP